MLKPGDPVRLNCPENERLHGTLAAVAEPAEWGAHLDAPAAATGRFRALHSEMVPLAPVVADPTRRAREEGFSGDACPQCGSMKMRRNGSCLLCAECGSTTGCS